MRQVAAGRRGPPASLGPASRLPAIFLPASALPALLLLAGCGTAASPPPGGLRPEAPLPSDATLEAAGSLMALEAFPEADAVLRHVAASCRSEDGRRALLLLSALWLDPRNPASQADSAALHAARYLALPDTDAAERALAASLYAAALELGADPARPSEGDDVPPPAPDAGPGACRDRARLSATAAELPSLGRESLAASAGKLRRERDALSTRSTRLAESNGALEGRVQELEAELQRIRRLLGADPDTTRRP